MIDIPNKPLHVLPCHPALHPCTLNHKQDSYGKQGQGVCTTVT